MFFDCGNGFKGMSSSLRLMDVLEADIASSSLTGDGV